MEARGAPSVSQARLRVAYIYTTYQPLTITICTEDGNLFRDPEPGEQWEA